MAASTIGEASRAPAAHSPLRGPVLAAGLLLGLAAGCGEPNAYVEPPPPEVTVATPVRRAVTEYFEATGTTQPVLSVDIRARVKGFLKERHFKEGSIVKKGQLLLVIDEEPFQVALDQAKTRLAEAEASLRKAKQSRAREVARAQLALDESQLQLAQLAEARQRNLIARDAGTREELDQAEATRKKTEAQVEADRRQPRPGGGRLRDQHPRRRGQRRRGPARRSATPRSSWAIAGCTPRSTAGSAGSTTTSATSSATARRRCWRRSSRSTRSTPTSTSASTTCSGSGARPAAAGRAGADGPSVPMELALADETGYPHRGTARLPGPGARPRHRHHPGPRRLPEPRRRDPARAVRPASACRSAERKDALLVPERALGTDQSGQYLLVVGKDDVVEYRPVKAGTLLDEMRVVEGKIGPDDRVVVDGLLRARPKLKVKPEARTDGVAERRGRRRRRAHVPRPVDHRASPTHVLAGSSSSGRSSPTSSRS